MKKLVFVALIALGFYHWYSKPNGQAVAHVATVHDHVYMYSLTTCGYCKKKAREMADEGILFTEYYIDKEPERNQELSDKLKKAGFTPQGYGTPILDVHGVMLPNNPSLDTIKKYLLAGQA